VRWRSARGAPAEGMALPLSTKSALRRLPYLSLGGSESPMPTRRDAHEKESVRRGADCDAASAGRGRHGTAVAEICRKLEITETTTAFATRGGIHSGVGSRNLQLFG